MNARKILLVIGVCGVVCFVAIVAVALYFLQEKTEKENSDRTAKARAARWATKDEPKDEAKKANDESFKDLEQMSNEVKQDNQRT